MQDAGPATTVDERNGNWVALRHDDGWVTTYAHMRNGSLAVRVGQRVARGDKLGLVGLSGNTDFPHLHFAVTRGNVLLDPFRSEERRVGKECVVRVALGGRRIIKKKNTQNRVNDTIANRNTTDVRHYNVYTEITKQ